MSTSARLNIPDPPQPGIQRAESVELVRITAPGGDGRKMTALLDHSHSALLSCRLPTSVKQHLRPRTFHRISLT